jgi:inorganic phosphate transporter, PiT family
MFPSFDGSLGFGTLLLLFCALAIALGFEFVNGFHDTANAVATVIYTKSLPPRPAVLWSGFCNFCGVYLGGTAVAFSVVNLLPVDVLIEAGSGAGLGMVLSLLVAAIVWNLGTWYLGLPTSSSHTLIGAILGVGLTHSWLAGHPGRGVNWEKAGEVGLSLLLSPVIGFVLAGALLLFLRSCSRDPVLYAPPPSDRPPPRWIRATLILTCTGVSFAHGSNDGQKGIGLIMLILIGIVPGHYLLDPSADANKVARAAQSVEALSGYFATTSAAPISEDIQRDFASVQETLKGRATLQDLDVAARRQFRGEILRIGEAISKVADHEPNGLSLEDRRLLEVNRRRMESLTEYAPGWTLVAVALALGVGTTVGWRRIVETVGEKIGKSHLTYAQGACAELVAMTTIGLASLSGLPVSTTHVLSSGIAGTMAANRSGLQMKTVRNIAIAWVLTLPAAMFLSSVLYLLSRMVLR